MPPSHQVPDFSGEEALFWRELHDRVPEVPPSAPDAMRVEEDALREHVKRAFREWYLRACRKPVESRQLELIRSSYDDDELSAVLDVMMDGRMTMGARTAAFEEAWARFLGCNGALMVNSGSSANLLAFAALSAPDLPNGLRPGDEVIVPAVTWSTSVFPIVQMGCVPVLVDIAPDTLNLDVELLAQAITPKTRAILAVHLLGNPCEMDRIMALARRYALWVVEDCCEAHGAMVGTQAVGTFGDLSTFSFFFSHHMTTVEGGMVCFRDEAQWRDRLISLRAHGWVRGRSDRERWKAQCPEIDDRWLFVTLGYNLRPTDINAAIGLVQLEKLPGFIRNRQAVRRQVLERLHGKGQWLRFQVERPGHVHSAFGLSILVDPRAPFTRQAFQAHLEAHRIQTRPIVGSNFARQPVMRHLPHRIHGTLTNADLVHYHGLMVGNHHDVTLSQVTYLAEVVLDFLERYKR
jgi:CDP-6-deoxy-D-xylo-4-hexulose-3-dehydrase